MPSPGRRAITLLRRSAQEVRRLRVRADAIQHARRSLSLSNVEGVLALQEDAQRHIADGTIVMGRESYFAPIVRKFKGDTGRVIVGNFVSIAHGVEFYSGGMHRTEWVSQYGLRAMLDLPGAYEDGFPHGRGDIHVGHDAWLAQGSVVMSGVTIGPGAVVATRSVVTKDVAPYAIVGGVPAKQIGQRFDDDQVEALLRIAWWDWPLDTIKERVGLLSSPDVDAFIACYDPAVAH
ncbi:MAG: chloramphenicol O-acetyltransferase type [Solirubrobacteraceae bacterium]|jgi:acetyltransferase-like isoleucine patch superfamily enzyme|nr:chloramphenicol O-acetyltransferase type [Solirubrobacteraceae bacterium]